MYMWFQLGLPTLIHFKWDSIISPLKAEDWVWLEWENFSSLTLVYTMNVTMRKKLPHLIEILISFPSFRVAYPGFNYFCVYYAFYSYSGHCNLCVYNGWVHRTRISPLKKFDEWIYFSETHFHHCIDMLKQIILKLRLGLWSRYILY